MVPISGCYLTMLLWATQHCGYFADKLRLPAGMLLVNTQGSAVPEGSLRSFILHYSVAAPEDIFKA